MSGVEGGTLDEVLAAHHSRIERAGIVCLCGETFDRATSVSTHYRRHDWDAHRAHVAAAVQTWLSERLGSEEVLARVDDEIGLWIGRNEALTARAATAAVHAIKAAITEEGK